MKRICNFLVLSSIFIFVGCKKNKTNNQSENETKTTVIDEKHILANRNWKDSISKVFAIPVDSINQLIIDNEKQSLSISYSDSTIVIKQKDKQDINIGYLSPQLLAFPCKGLISVEGKKWENKNHLMFGNILLLPVFGANSLNPVNLLLINTETGKCDSLSNGSPFFVADPTKKSIMNTSALLINQRISVNYHQVVGDEIKLSKKEEYLADSQEKWIPIIYFEANNIAFLKKEFVKLNK